MKPETSWRVQHEQQAHREAVKRLCAAYRILFQEPDKPEVENENDSRPVCSCLNPTSGG
jgi:adenylate cyclase